MSRSGEWRRCTHCDGGDGNCEECAGTGFVPKPKAHPLPLSRGSVEWLQALAREHERGAEWVPALEAWPSETFRPCCWLGLVEMNGDRFRLTGFGWGALSDLIEAVD